jgi:histidine ammonia-lyase
MLNLDGHNLGIDDIVVVARAFEKVGLSADGLAQIEKSQEAKKAILESGLPVYGINTGFGIFADKQIANADSAKLSRNLILSHAVGTGAPLAREIVRAAMLVRANTLTKGFSGVGKDIIETLIAMLNLDLIPVIPSQGSLGSSGDLGPLSHLALVFTTDENDLESDSGLAEFDGKVQSGKSAMEKAGIKRLVLGPKEGLAINNGATFSAAISALCISDASYLLGLAEISLALSLEAMLGCSAAFDARIHKARGQIGQMQVAENVQKLISGSGYINLSGRVQDAYSLRCAPQVQGIARDTLEFVEKIISREINAATDNPLIFDSGIALSGGNFHGEPVGVAADFLSIVISEMAAISERRINRMTDANLNGGLPPMLVDSFEAAGLNSGLMMPQYTAASLVLENSSLAHPDSVHSLPTSGDQEDHNANAMTAARHAYDILQNTFHVIAIELYTAARAIDLRKKMHPKLKLGHGTQLAYDIIRSEVPYQAGDALWGPEIETIKKLLKRKSFDAVIDGIKS